MKAHASKVYRKNRKRIIIYLSGSDPDCGPSPSAPHTISNKTMTTTRVPSISSASSDAFPNSYSHVHLSRHVRLTSRTQPRPADQRVLLGHEVRVTANAVGRVQPGQDLIDEVGLAFRTDIAELGDPDGQAVGLSDGLADMVLEVRDRRRDAIAGAAVPMDIQEVDLTAGALLHKIAEPGKTHGGAGVGDGGGAEFGRAAGKGLHVVMPARGGVGGR